MSEAGFLPLPKLLPPFPPPLAAGLSGEPSAVVRTVVCTTLDPLGRGLGPAIHALLPVGGVDGEDVGGRNKSGHRG
jgi:hypothetical protein